MPISERPLAAFFQAVTLRTAGFNSIDQQTLTAGSRILGIALMFIGAAPASTGGGIKLSTFSVVFAGAFCQLRGDDDTILRKHRITHTVFSRALIIFLLGISVFFIAAFMLCCFEHQAIAQGHLRIIDLLYEAMSAFGTVGVSSIDSSQLSFASHFLLILVMFLGRVGPASFATGLSFRRPRQAERLYPEGRTFVG